MASNTYSVVLTEGAEQDLESIYDYITEFDSVRSADYVLERLKADSSAVSTSR